MPFMAANRLELSFAEGRWPNVKNVGVFAPYMRDMMAYVRARGLPVETIVIDMETSLDKINALLDAFKAGELGPAIDALLDDYDRPTYEAGTAAFAALVDDAHAMGFRVHLTIPGLTPDDFGDGDHDLHRLFDMALAGVDWDEISYQLYRTLFSEIVVPIVGGEDILSPYYVYSYARSIREEFGDRAAVDLGIVGGDFLGNAG
ncbi:MAG: hypothetical protein K8I02_12120, partial [Candidatus Methylomirabilis sp.]|nr:hypothetical protein [Deltaproteobacteria bacterium]